MGVTKEEILPLALLSLTANILYNYVFEDNALNI